MSEGSITQPELPNLVTLLARQWRDTGLSHQLYAWENVIFSLIIMGLITLWACFSLRKTQLIPNRAQSCVELFGGTVDDFVCGVLGPQGRKYTPFIGTLFIYIICMNLFGMIPLMKSPTTSWSTTLALALCVFVYVQFTAWKELGFMGYIYHLMGRPKGVLAFTVIVPLLMFFLHLLTELIRPLSLSLRLRSNIWGEDILLAIMAGFGLKGVPLLFINTVLAILGSVIQAVVFCLLTTIYFALVLVHEEETA